MLSVNYLLPPLFSLSPIGSHIIFLNLIRTNQMNMKNTEQLSSFYTTKVSEEHSKCFVFIAVIYHLYVLPQRPQLQLMLELY